MNNQIDRNKLSLFLVDAKRKTYASGGEESNTIVIPSLPGSHQLEYCSGSFLYRDIYFGGAYFVGLETVYFENRSIWAMSYGGGFTANIENTEESGIIGNILQSALREIPQDIPFRGPKMFLKGEYKYINNVEGDLFQFSGNEFIESGGIMKYQLKYIGGMLL